jgi:GNAT superfamily N-acetyltransferase
LIFKDYDIVPCESEFYPQVIDLLKYLLGSYKKRNTDYFKWKYIDNPNLEYSPGIMALYNGKVVGFRGYCPLQFRINDKRDSILSLIPGDTCVHPDHRRKGLSVIMDNKVAEEYIGKYSFFLNMTATKNSLPRYLKMGYHSLISKEYLTKNNNWFGQVFIIYKS